MGVGEDHAQRGRVQEVHTAGVQSDHVGAGRLGAVERLAQGIRGADVELPLDPHDRGVLLHGLVLEARGAFPGWGSGIRHVLAVPVLTSGESGTGRAAWTIVPPWPRTASRSSRPTASRWWSWSASTTRPRPSVSG